LPPDKAAANVDYLRSIVQLDAKPLATGSLPTPKAQAAREAAAKQAAAEPPAGAVTAAKEKAGKSAKGKQPPEIKSAAAEEGNPQSGTNWATGVDATRPRR